MAELAANARAGQEAAEAQLHDVQQRLAALEVRVAALEVRERWRSETCGAARCLGRLGFVVNLVP